MPLVVLDNFRKSSLPLIAPSLVIIEGVMKSRDLSKSSLRPCGIIDQVFFKLVVSNRSVRTAVSTVIPTKAVLKVVPFLQIWAPLFLERLDELLVEVRVVDSFPPLRVLRILLRLP